MWCSICACVCVSDKITMLVNVCALWHTAFIRACNQCDCVRVCVYFMLLCVCHWPCRQLIAGQILRNMKSISHVIITQHTHRTDTECASCSLECRRLAVMFLHNSADRSMSILHLGVHLIRTQLRCNCNIRNSGGAWQIIMDVYLRAVVMRLEGAYR